MLNLHLVTVIGSIREPQDFLGNPTLASDGYVDMSPPRLAQTLASPLTLLLVDELTTCPQQIQAALLRISHERYIGDTKLHCKIIAAANPPGEAVGGMDIYAAMANRYIHLNWEMVADDYARGMETNWAHDIPQLPDNWTDTIPTQQSLISRFLSSFRPELLNTGPAEGEYAFASPRTWAFAARFLAAAKSAQLTTDHVHLGLRGCVGSGAATELAAWLALQTTVDLEEVVSAPQNHLDHILNESADVQAAVFNGIADMVGGKVDPMRFHTIIRAALDKGYAASMLQAALTRCSGKLPRERYIAIERSIKKYQTAWEGTGAANNPKSSGMGSN